jgi:hypothetical protein
MTRPSSASRHEGALSTAECAMMGAKVGGRVMRRPTLFLTVGLPATGKTRAARRIELEPTRFASRRTNG